MLIQRRLPRPARRRPRYTRGVSLIEMMVGMTLGMIVAAAMLVLFANASSQGQNVQRASEQIENGRYLADLVGEDLRLTGFFGELMTDSATFSTPDPCATTPTGFVASPLTVPVPVQGFGPADVLACLAASSRLAGTDAVALRRVDTATATVASIGGASQQFYLQSSFCSDDPPTTPLVFDKLADQFTLRNRACGADNIVRAYVSRIYFVASCNVCGSDTVPTLKRLDLVGNQLVESALVEGVETFRLEYGFDTDNNGSPDVYRTTLAAAGPESLWQNVVSVKLHYIIRSLDRASGGTIAGAQVFQLGAIGAVSTASDGFSRRAYSTTQRLINPSGAREAQ